MKLKGNEHVSASDQHLFEADSMHDGDEPDLIDDQRTGTQVFDEIPIISGDKNTNINSAAPHNSEDNFADPFDLFIEDPNTETIDSSVVSPVISERNKQITHNIIEATIENMDDVLKEAQNQKEKMASHGLVQCGIWDFAGQKDYYATHQTFFTPHAIYLLVTDIKDEIGDTKHYQSFDSIGGRIYDKKNFFFKTCKKSFKFCITIILYQTCIVLVQDMQVVY